MELVTFPENLSMFVVAKLGTCCNCDDIEPTAFLTLPTAPPNLSVTELVVTEVALDKNELKVLVLVGEPGALPPLFVILFDLVLCNADGGAVDVVVDGPKGFLEPIEAGSSCSMCAYCVNYPMMMTVSDDELIVSINNVILLVLKRRLLAGTNWHHLMLCIIYSNLIHLESID